MFAQLFLTLPIAQAQAPSPGGTQGVLFQLVPIFVIIAIFFFLVIRPQQKKQKEHEAMLSALKKGESVITTGGIYGLIAGVKENTLSLKIADNVKIDVTKNSIATVIKNNKEVKK